MSRLIRRLQRHGVIVVEEDPTDRRAMILRATPAGIAMRVAAMTRRRELMAEALASRPGPLPRDLGSGLDAIADALEHYVSQERLTSGVAGSGWAFHAQESTVESSEPRQDATGLDLSTIVGAAASRKGLRLRDDIQEEGWTFWELRNLNIHRVVGLVTDAGAVADVRVLEAQIRGAIARDFHRSWWRGLAYGVVAQTAPTSWTPHDLAALVDGYENRNGVLQWVVLVAGDGRTAVAVHTWEEVFLSPVYRETLGALTAAGQRTASAVKGRDGLLKFLTGVSELKGVSFPEFHDRR